MRLWKRQAKRGEGMRNRLVKFSVKKGTYFFKWETYQREAKRWDAFTISSKDEPRPELIERLKALADHVPAICEFPSGDALRIIVSGITEAYTDTNRYLTIICQKRLENSKAPLVINTPPRPKKPGAGMTEAQCMSEELLADLSALEEEAWRYINGDRAQQVLDLESGDPPEAA